MIKRRLLMLMIFAFMAASMLAVFSACNPTWEVEDISIRIYGAGGELVFEVESRGYESNSVADILRENMSELGIPAAQINAGFISTIRGITPVWVCSCDWMLPPVCDSDRYFWAFYINDESSDVGIIHARVEDGDVIIFRIIGG